MSTSLSSLSGNFFPSPQNGFTTTLASTISSGAATVPLNSVAGYSNGQIAVFVIEPSSSTAKQTFTGVIDTSGVQVTSVVWTAGTNQTHAGGVTVVDYATATHIGMMTKGITQQHTQAGAHTAITATSMASTGAVSGTTGTFTSTLNASTVSTLQDTGVALSTYRKESQTAFTVSGGVWTADAAGSTKNASMTAWTGYINGQRGTIGAVTARVFTASKDTYVDVLDTAGVFTLVYTEVTNAAAAPALAANSIRIAIVVTGATNIASAASITQLGTDSLGNSIYNRLPYLPGSPVTNAVATSESTASTSYVGLTTPQTCVVTVGSSGLLQVTVGCGLVGTGGNLAYSSFALSGANTLASADVNGISSNATTTDASQYDRTKLLTGLTPGVTTVTAQYRVGGGTGTFKNRNLVAIPL